MKIKNTNLKLAIKNSFLKRKSSSVVLEPHLGLGDGIICLGLVREISKREPESTFYYASLNRNFYSFSWMFQDLNNVFILPVNHGREARQYSGFKNVEYREIGVSNVELNSFDEYFYKQHNVSFEKRWTNSRVAPGLNSKTLFKKLNPDNEPYIIVAENSSSGVMNHPLKIINKNNKKIIEVKPYTNNIFDWIDLTLGASEIHAVDSAYLHFVESTLFQMPVKPLYYHKLRKSYGEFTRKLRWEVVY